MTDFGRGPNPAEEDRLPWLEAVEDEDGPRGPGAGRLIAAVIVALAIIGLVVGGVFWLRDRTAPGAAGDGDLIAAPEGAYKTKPDSPGGMTVEGQGGTAYAASEGADTAGAIDLTALPEAPVTDAKTAVTTADAAAANPKAAAAQGKVATGPTPTPAKVAAAAAPKPAPAPKPEAPAAGGTVQLGAFGSEAKANAAWKTLSKRYAFLAPFTPLIQPVASGDKTLYRLRISTGGQAATICGKLTVAGETCARVG